MYKSIQFLPPFCLQVFLLENAFWKAVGLKSYFSRVVKNEEYLKSLIFVEWDGLWKTGIQC
jgi:hypothetical protein